MKVVCIGGGGSALVALRTMRGKNPDIEPTVLTQRDVGGYRPCELTYVLAGYIETYEEIAALTDEERALFRLRTEATGVDPETGTVSVVDAEGRQDTLAFDKLLLAMGARSLVPPIPGIDAGLVADRVVAPNTDMETFRRLDRLAEGAGSAVVIGAGAIGLEVAEGLTARGLTVTVVEAAPRALARAFDDDFGEDVVRRLEGKGVAFRMAATVDGIEPTSQGVAVAASGETIACDLVAVCAGFVPNVGLARKAGLSIGESGHIAVDRHQRTSAEGIYACGDCAENLNLVTGAAEPNMLAVNAVVTGKVAGHNIAKGDSRTSQGFVPSIVVRLADAYFGGVGLTVEGGRAHGFDAASVDHTAPGKPKYLGGHPVRVRIVAERGTGRLLGAQMSSADDVAGELDRLALGIEHRLTADSLSTSVSCYTPPVTMPYTPVAQALDRLLPLL